MKINFLKSVSAQKAVAAGIILSALLLIIPQTIRAEELKYKNLFIGWKSVEGAFGYRVEVKNNAGEPVIVNDVRTNSVNIRVPEGDFKLRIGAMNRQNMIENWSDWKDIKIQIKNPPQPPAGLAAAKTILSRNQMNIRLVWDSPPPADGGAVTYSILKLVDNNYEKAAQTNETEYLFSGLQRGRVYNFQVFSVNKDGEESLKGLEIAVDDWFIPVNIIVKGNYIVPLMKFGDLFEYGYGSILDIYLSDIFINNLNAGIESGFIYLKGKNSDASKHLNADNSYIIPVCLNISCPIDINDYFSIRPFVSSGYAYNRMQYTDDNKEAREKIFWNPVFSGGLDFLYTVNYYSAFGIGCQYSVLFESAGNLYFTGINLYGDFRFDL